MSWRIGVDIGGTFIDFCALETGTDRVETIKVLTTPDEPGKELLDGLRLLQERHGIAPGEVVSFVHGTTVGINTIIQRKGSRLALITTAGFEDVIELARLRMPEMYSLFCARPEQLIPRDRMPAARSPRRSTPTGSPPPWPPSAPRASTASSSPSSMPIAMVPMRRRRRR